MALGEVLVAQQAALQEGARACGGRRGPREGGDLGRRLLGAMEGGLADDLGIHGVAVVGLEEHTQAGHGGGEHRPFFSSLVKLLFLLLAPGRIFFVPDSFLGGEEGWCCFYKERRRVRLVHSPSNAEVVV